MLSLKVHIVSLAAMLPTYCKCIILSFASLACVRLVAVADVIAFLYPAPPYDNVRLKPSSHFPR